jgi:hypothetical protein
VHLLEAVTRAERRRREPRARELRRNGEQRVVKIAVLPR